MNPPPILHSLRDVAASFLKWARQRAGRAVPRRLVAWPAPRPFGTLRFAGSRLVSGGAESGFMTVGGKQVVTLPRLYMPLK